MIFIEYLQSIIYVLIIYFQYKETFLNALNSVKDKICEIFNAYWHFNLTLGLVIVLFIVKMRETCECLYKGLFLELYAQLFMPLNGFRLCFVVAR